MPENDNSIKHASQHTDVLEKHNPTVSFLMRGALFVSFVSDHLLLIQCFVACGRFDFHDINRGASRNRATVERAMLVVVVAPRNSPGRRIR